MLLEPSPLALVALGLLGLNLASLLVAYILAAKARRHNTHVAANNRAARIARDYQSHRASLFNQLQAAPKAPSSLGSGWALPGWAPRHGRRRSSASPSSSIRGAVAATAATAATAALHAPTAAAHAGSSPRASTPRAAGMGCTNQVTPVRRPPSLTDGSASAPSAPPSPPHSPPRSSPPSPQLSLPSWRPPSPPPSPPMLPPSSRAAVMRPSQRYRYDAGVEAGRGGLVTGLVDMSRQLTDRMHSITDRLTSLCAPMEIEPACEPTPHTRGAPGALAHASCALSPATMPTATPIITMHSARTRGRSLLSSPLAQLA